MNPQTGPGGEMVDTLVSGASAARHAGSTPVLGTRLQHPVASSKDDVTGLIVIRLKLNYMALINKDQKYKWEFCNIGGTSRVKISSGKDIANLYQLDTKMWTVLSCPVKGLEIDEKSLNYMDCDADGKIRVNDVIKTATWVTDAVNNDDMVLNEEDFIYIKLQNVITGI